VAAPIVTQLFERLEVGYSDVPEDQGMAEIEAAVSSALAVATHRITYVEIHATLARAVRMGRIQASSLDHRLRDFETRWASLDVVDLTEPMVRRAAALAVQDALAGSRAVAFAATDQRLADAARLAGLQRLALQ
jgi:hypothetical protein